MISLVTQIMISKIKLSFFAVLLLIIEQPFVLHINPAEYLKTPKYIIAQIHGQVSDDNLKDIKDMRWSSRDKGQTLIGKIFYSKPILITKETFNALGNLSLKRLFFGGYFIWPLLFPFVAGLILLIKQKSFIPLVLIASVFITVITGQPTASFLLPTLLIVAIISNRYIRQQSNAKFLLFHIVSFIVIFANNAIKI
jgi:hypothetical protein